MTRPAPLPVFEPESVPVTHRDAGLPVPGPERLRAEGLRRRLAAPPPWQPELFRDVSDSRVAPRPAAVLVPLVPRPQGMQMLLTVRTSHLSVHAGQISFPGGRRDPGDADATATALREAHEEIGLPPAAIEPIGAMPQYTTITGFTVTPVVGLIDPAAELRPHPGEVAEVFEVPLAFLMDPAHHEVRSWDDAEGESRSFFAMPWTDDQGRRYFIWGATAAMIRNLWRLLIA